MRHEHVFDGLAQPIANVDSGIEIGSLQEHREFLAAVTGDKIRFSRQADHAGPDGGMSCGTRTASGLPRNPELTAFATLRKHASPCT